MAGVKFGALPERTMNVPQERAARIHRIAWSARVAHIALW